MNITKLNVINNHTKALVYNNIIDVSVLPEKGEKIPLGNPSFIGMPENLRTSYATVKEIDFKFCNHKQAGTIIINAHINN